MVKPHDLLVPLDSHLTVLTSVAYQRSNLLRVFSHIAVRDILSRDGFRT